MSGPASPRPPVPPCRLRESLRSGRLAVGTMLIELRQPSVPTLLAHAGLDFVLIDWEHGPFSLETVADLSRAARAAGVTPIVRPPELAYAWITQPLDAGAQGIMLPRVTTAEQVAQAVRWMKYPPQGARGVVLARGHTDFLPGPLANTLESMNCETLLVVQIETREALERLDQVLAVPGVDVALVGPTDLSVALGVPGELEHPSLVAAIERVQEACARHGVVPAIHTNDLALTTHWARRGMRMVSIGSEVGLLLQSARAAVASIRG